MCLFGVRVEINGTIIVQIFIFLMLLFWLSPVLFRPILRLFDEREKRIEGAKREAAEIERLAEEKSALFDREYNQAKTKAREVLGKLKQVADKEQRDILDKAKLESRAMLEKSDEELLAEEQRVRAELSKESDQIKNDIIKMLMGKRAKKM